VRLAVKSQTAVKRGRVPVSDWPQLLDILREDARSWLDGRNPFKARSNRSIALSIAANVPTHNHAAIYGRMMRKLRERRYYYTLVDAEHFSYSGYPYADNLRAIAALRGYAMMGDQWNFLLVLRESSLADYRRKFGEPPEAMTMQDLVIEASKPIVGISATPSGNVFQILIGSGSR